LWKKKILSPRIITVLLLLLLLLLLLCIRTVGPDGIPSRKINKRITINYIILFVGICAFGAIIIIIIITSRWSFKQNFFQEKNRHALFAANDCTECTHTCAFIYIGVFYCVLTREVRKTSNRHERLL